MSKADQVTMRRRKNEGRWSEPASTANQITYEYFCVLGGLSDARCQKLLRRNGSHHYYTYHLCSY